MLDQQTGEQAGRQAGVWVCGWCCWCCLAGWCWLTGGPACDLSWMTSWRANGCVIEALVGVVVSCRRRAGLLLLHAAIAALRCTSVCSA